MNNTKWNFDNTYAKLPNIFFTRQHPAAVATPQLVEFNHKLANELGIPCEPEVFAGNCIPCGAEPISQAYAGHQFGHFNMLGDGRAVLIGEHISPCGKRFDIQLKGSGRTPYSRGGDGRAALGPMLREYIISEAMHSLGIPTTRSLAVIETGEPVIRERKLPGAILTRIAASHIRVGTFEYAAHFSTIDDLRTLADYTIIRHFPLIESADNKYIELLKEVVKRQAALIAKWQLVGFVHGVMNTDNMAISGETIDYGPCAFMDAYNPDTVFSSIDTHGRYAYKNQPKMAMWNLARFAETLLPLLHEDKNKAVKLAQTEVENFKPIYENYWLDGMRTKLGLAEKRAEDELLIADLLQKMEASSADYTNTFRSLTVGEIDKRFVNWHKRWQARVSGQDKTETAEHMKRNNPCVIPRNYFVEEALAAAENGDLKPMERLLGALGNPYAYTPEQDKYTQPPTQTSCNYKTFCGT